MAAIDIPVTGSHAGDAHGDPDANYLKATHGMPPADPEREACQIARLRSLAVTADLDPEFAEKFLNFLVTEVIRHHEIIAAAARA